MINADMREYGYYLYGDQDAYGQVTLSTEIKGTVKLSIYPITQALADNIKYSGCSYVGLSFDTDINDTFVVQFHQEKLKVQYVNTFGRYRQVFLQAL